ncbi:PAS domain S-box protein [Desulfocicer niacini]
MNADNLILVVDDDPPILSATVKLLKQAGYTVIEAQTGEQALKSAQENLPDLILLDNELPDIDGLEICHRLKTEEKTSGIFIILSVKRIKASDQSEGLEIGADEYIVRPIGNRELLARVKSMLRLKNAEKELEKQQKHLNVLVEQRTAKLQHEIAKHKVTEQRLRASEERYKFLFENINDAVYVHQVLPDGQPGKFHQVNKAAREMLGYTDEEFKSMSPWELDDPKTSAQIIPLAMEQLQRNGQTKFEAIQLARNGRQVCVETNTVLTNFQGQKTIISVCRNITEFKKVKEALQESENKYRKVVESANEGIAVTQDGMLKFINRKILEISGYSEVALMSRPFIEFIHAEDRQMVMQHHIKMLEDEKTLGVYALRFIAKSGDLKWMENNGVSITWEGKPATLNFLSDITARKRAEGALRESEERFRQVYNHMSIGVAKVSLEFKIVAANPAYCKMLGYSEAELTGKHLREITHSDSIEKNILKQSQLAAGEIDHFRMEKRFIHKTSKIVYGMLDANLVRDSDGKPIYFLGSVADISDLKYAEELLRESEKKYRTILDSMKDAVYICNPDFLIEYMNPRMISTIGGDSTGDYCYKAIYGYNKKCSWCVLDNILQGEHIDYELANPKDNRFYSVTNSPIHHSCGTISKLTIFRDITDSKSIEAQLYQARKMESIGTIAGGIAHDFNNILYMITGNAELAMEDLPARSPAHKNLEEIKSAGLRAAGVVKQLLNFSRQSDQKFKPIDAVMVIKDALKFMRSTIPTTIELQQNFPEKEVTILGDPIQINQVMMNICINASHAMEDTGGVLDILVETTSINEKTSARYPDLAPGDWLKITINDTGPGISEDIIDRIFDPYFTTKGVGKGSGMGLAVVHGIVQNHHGTIFVESKPGKGATFTIFFPLLTEKPVTDVKASRKIPRGAGEKILFVDDEVSITNMIGIMLERLGYKVQTTTSPVDALELFRSKPDGFDLVLTDMTMPKMTGVRLSEKLKEIRPEIPVVICTGYSAIINKEKAESIGIDGFVMKPIEMSDIAKTIQNILDMTKATTQG